MIQRHDSRAFVVEKSVEMKLLFSKFLYFDVFCRRFASFCVLVYRLFGSFFTLKKNKLNSNQVRVCYLVNAYIYNIIMHF